MTVTPTQLPAAPADSNDGDEPTSPGDKDVGDGVIVVDGEEGGKASSRCCRCQGIKQFLLYDSSLKENQAFYLNQFGRSTLFISFMFLSLGVLQIANQQAGCPQNANGSYTNCGNKVYGMQPSSMLALMAVISGVSTSCFMPYAGTVVDFTDHRLGFGKINALLLTLTNFVQVFLFEQTWFAIIILQSIVASATFTANWMVMWSYVSAPNDHKLHGITSSGRVWETSGMLGFFIVVGAVQFTSGWDSIEVARFSQAFATVVGGTSLFLSYKRYGPVKAVKTLEKKADGTDVNLYLAGIRGLLETMTTLGKTDPSAARFLVGSIFVEASMDSFTNLVVTYLSQQVRETSSIVIKSLGPSCKLTLIPSLMSPLFMPLHKIEMSATGIIVFIMVNLATNPIGIILHRTLARKVGHKRSYVCCIAYTLIMAPIMIGTVYSPQQSKLAYFFGVMFGISYGWYKPSSTGYYVSLVPKEKVVELWGLNSFCSVILSWVPPIIFAVLNETTGNMRVGWIGVITCEIIGLAISLTIPEKMYSCTSEVDCSVDEERGSKIDGCEPIHAERIE